MVTVSLINMKGGVGKTTIAVNLADFLTKRHSKRVLVIDIDPQFNATQCILPGPEYLKHLGNDGRTIIDIFNAMPKIDVSVVNGNTQSIPVSYENITPISSKRGFDLIPGRLDLFRHEMAPGQGKELRLKNYLKTVSDIYDICIIDSPPTPSVWMASALIASDFYLIPVKADPISMTGIDLLVGIIQEKKDNYGCECKCCGVVLTMVERKTKVFSEALQFLDKSELWKPLVYKKNLPKRTQLAQKQLNNIFISDINDYALRSDFAAIVNEFLERIG